MLPSYHHGGSMPGMGSKPLRRPWFQDVNGTLIAILVLAVVLALEHFYFQSRLARVSALEVSLAIQLKDVEASMKQHTDQLRKMNPKLDEIDNTELSLKRLQEEASKAISGLADVQATLAEIQRANTTARFIQEAQQQRQNLTALASQLDEVLRFQTSSKEALTDLSSRVANLQSNVTKLASKLESHNSALKTLADQLELHQNSTLSALQQQTVAVSEALEAHKALQERVDNLNMSAAASSPVKAEAMEAAVSLGGRGAGAGYGSPTGTDGGNGKVSTEAKVSGELATVGDAAAGMGSVDPVPQATSAKTMESLQAMPGGNLSNISVGIRGVGKGTATSAQLLERPINGWNATTGVEGAEGVPKLAAVAGVKNTGMNQAAVEATISNVDEDSQLVREHVALTLDDGEKTSSASTIQAAENSTTAVAANEANSTADTTRAAGSTNVADAIHYNNTNVWTGWAVTKATSLNGRTVDLPTDASSKKTDAGKGAAGVVTEDDVKAGAQVGTIASANDSTITTKPVMATETARFVEGTASNSTGALDELDAFVSTATDSSRVQAAAGKGSVVDNGTGSAGGTSEEGTKIVISSAGGSTKTEAGDAWGWQIDHQVDGRVSDVEARRGHGDVEREQGQQNRGRRVRTGRNRFGRMQEQFQQHQSSDGAHARGASTSQVSVGVVTESTSTGTGRGAAIRAADALATMGAANDGETTDVATTGSGTGENASTHAADEHSGVLVDEEEQDHVE